MSNLKSIGLTVLELLAFNSHDRPLCTHKQTNTHTSNEHIISAIHFVHLAEIISLGSSLPTSQHWQSSPREHPKVRVEKQPAGEEAFPAVSTYDDTVNLQTLL